MGKKFGGKNIEINFKKTAKELNQKEWNFVLSEFKKSILDLSKKFNINTVILSGGIVDKQKQKIIKTINNIHFPKILFSKLKKDIGIYGGFAIIKSNNANVIKD